MIVKSADDASVITLPMICSTPWVSGDGGGQRSTKAVAGGGECDPINTVEEDLQPLESSSEADDPGPATVAEGGLQMNSSKKEKQRRREVPDHSGQVTVMKQGTIRGRGMCREKKKRGNTTRNGMHEAGRRYPRDGIDATRNPGGRNSLGRRRWYFPSDVRISFHEQLLMAVTLERQHKELKQLQKERDSKSCLPVPGMRQSRS